MTKLLVIRGGLAAIARSEEADPGRRVAVAATALPARCGRDLALERAVAEMDPDDVVLRASAPAWDAAEDAAVAAMDVRRDVYTATQTLRGLQDLGATMRPALLADLRRERDRVRAAQEAFEAALARVLGGES